MKNLKSICAAAICGAIMLGTPMLNIVNAAEIKTYQVTGPVLEVTANMIAVQKGKDRWELARDPGTKVSGDLKVGSKVTVTYKMIAQDVEVKDAKAKK
jgi:hypothetical protein